MTLILKKTTVMIVADHPIMRDGLRLCVQHEPDMCIICETDHELRALNEFERHRPDVTILDLQKPRGAGWRVVRAIRLVEPRAYIVVLTMYPWDVKLAPGLDEDGIRHVSKTASGDEVIAAVRRSTIHAARN